MRILLYNYVQPEESGSGGVGVYQANLARALAGRGHDVITMSSGDRCSFLKRSPYVEFSEDLYKRAVVVNSPTLAPAAFSAVEPGVYSHSTGLDFVPRLLKERYGQIGVFHFQNLEGLTKSFFVTLRQEFPDATMIYSVHNYYAMCSRVTLWFQESSACRDYSSGYSCTLCWAELPNSQNVRLRRRLKAASQAYPRAALIAEPLLRILNRCRRAAITARSWLRRQSSAPPVAVPASSATAFKQFREDNNELCRTVFDIVLAVSSRTRQVVTSLGVPQEKTVVSYIGTAHKSTFVQSSKTQDIGDGLHLAYLGYMTRDKGFHFFVECLEQMPVSLAERITVTVAAKNTDPDASARLQALHSRFRALRYFDGYTHDNLGDVLTGVNLGLVPVLWEDNLPQVAIELVSRGIPILTSDRGGAQEIASQPAFVFRAGNHDDFLDRIGQIADRALSLGDFWKGDMRIFSMDEHVDDLMQYYGSKLVAERESGSIARVPEHSG